MEMAGNITQESKQDINAKVDSAAGDQEHAERRKEDLLH